MGMLRKTLSVTTFGTVAYRSKKEKLRRAERAQREVELMLEREHAARVRAETRSGTAERRLRRAERRNRHRASATLAEKFVAAEPAMQHGVESAVNAGSHAAAHTRRAARRARKSAGRAVRHASAAATSAKEAATPHVQAAASHAAEAVERITSA